MMSRVNLNHGEIMRSSNIVLVLFSLAWIMGAYNLNLATQELEALGVKVPDLLQVPSRQEFTAVLQAFTPTTKEMYLDVLYSWDILFPIGYGGTLYLLCRRFDHGLALIPLVAMYADLVENLTITLCLNSFEQHGVITGLAFLFLVANSFKWVALTGSILVTAAAILRHVWKRVRKPNLKSQPE